MRTRTESFAPASIGNVAVGFDVLGLAIEGAGDRVICERAQQPGVRVVHIEGNVIAGDCSRLPTAPERNTAAVAAASFWSRHGDGGGLDIRLHKGTPLASGMGSSACSAVAAVVAANGLLGTPIPTADLLPFALEGEAIASGAIHADNVAPSLLGGLVLCPPASLPACYSVPVPDGLRSILVHPELSVETAAARQALSEQVALSAAVSQSGALAMAIDAAHRNEAIRFASNIRDVLVEPQRQHLVRGFSEVSRAARDAGALACSLSGSGPSLFALAEPEHAKPVADAMCGAFEALGVHSDAWESALDAPGATVQVLA